MTISLALFDVDGTLKHEASWLPGALDLLAAVADAGVPIALCSGRVADALHLIAEEVRGVAYLSGAGGTVVQERRAGGWHTLAETYLPPEVVVPIVEEAADAGIELWTYTPTRWVATRLTDRTAWETAATGVEPELGDPTTLDDVVKFVAVPRSDADRVALFALGERYPVGVVGSHPELIDVAPLSAVAWKGGDKLVEHLGLAWARVCAVGDGSNDLGMLGAAGLAFLMPPRRVGELAVGPGERFECSDLFEVLDHLRAGRLGS